MLDGAGWSPVVEGRVRERERAIKELFFDGRRQLCSG